MGTLTTYTHYRQADTTDVFNKQHARFFNKGVVYSAGITPEPGFLKVNVGAFVAVSHDGMIVEHVAPPATQLTVVANMLQYVVLNAQYNPSGPAITTLEVLTDAAYAAKTPTEKLYLIILVAIYIPGGQTEVFTSNLNYSGADVAGNPTVAADQIDSVNRSPFRGTADTKTSLPQDTGYTGEWGNRDGDIYLTRDTGILYRWKENLALPAHGTWEQVALDSSALYDYNLDPVTTYTHVEVLSPFEMASRMFLTTGDPSAARVNMSIPAYDWTYVRRVYVAPNKDYIVWHIHPPAFSSTWTSISFRLMTAAGSISTSLSLISYTNVNLGSAGTVIATTTKAITNTWDVIQLTTFSPAAIDSSKTYVVYLELGTGQTAYIANGSYTATMLKVPVLHGR